MIASARGKRLNLIHYIYMIYSLEAEEYNG